MKKYLIAILWPDGHSYTNIVTLSHDQWIKLSDTLAMLEEDKRIRWGTVHLLGDPISKTEFVRDLYIFAIDVDL